MPTPEQPMLQPPGSALTVADLDYELPPELIAHEPAVHREDARMMRIHRKSGTIADSTVRDLPDILRPGDVLVLNDTRVLPARFMALRTTGGKVPGLFVEERGAGLWRVMLQGSGRLRPGQVLHIPHPTDEPVSLRLVESLGEGLWLVEVTPPEPAHQILDRVGETPLPPYIRRLGASTADERDRERYQTVYARAPGAVAAPTAGLHFTDELLQRVRQRGVEIAYVTLHVGLGTFKPIAVERLSDHVMHAERFDLPKPTAEAINAARARGGRIVAVGTTVVRVLETAAARPAESTDRHELRAQSGQTDIFIHSAHRFAAVDALLTNFHLPRSTLLALVMAFAGADLTRRAYQHAVERRYRFYSYGDAMLIE